jgi:ADP-ribose pyrophosphatase YjhB (NUDIX family)
MSLPVYSRLCQEYAVKPIKPIRNSAKALIIVDNHILATKNLDAEGVFYILPGGGQQPGETLTATLERECREELSVDVSVADLLYIREYIGRNHVFAKSDADQHRLEFMFACTLNEGAVVGAGDLPDDNQVGAEWLPLDQLESYRFYPKALRPILAEYGSGKHTVYLGDIN